MKFTPEDGTGLSAANCYCTLAFADDYHALRGNAAWASADTGKRQAALVKATDYINQNWNFVGERATVGQGLEWPRVTDPATSGVPIKLQQATAQLALEALTTDLSPTTPAQAVKRIKADVVEKEFFEPSAQGSVRKAIAGLLKGLVVATGFNVPVRRV